ncbi:MAG: protein kinase [Elusimicrobiota bacterium]
MKSTAGLMALLLLGAASAAAAPAPGDTDTTAQDQARFDLLKKRFLQQQGIPPSAAGGVVAPPPVAGQAPPPPAPSWEQQERERSMEFNKQFGAGSYEGIIGFSKRCLSADGCDKLATADVIDGAYKFVDLQKDVEKKVVAPDSSAYRERHGEIKGGMRAAMEEFRPRPGARTAYENDFIKFSDPIVKKIFTKDELLQYAQQNAASADSSPFYTYLGQTLNAGSGSPGKARQAFDAALERDPKNEEALSGRAQARLGMSDFPGAVADARAALRLDPGDQRALAALKFSEGRLAGGTGSAAPPAGSAASAPTAASGAEPDASWPARGSAQAGLIHPGDSATTDAARRSAALVAEAKRSLGLGDAGSAARSLRQALELNPRSAEVLSLSAMAAIRLGKYSDALAAAEAGLALAPRSAALLDAEASALLGMKDYRAALVASEMAIAANPQDAMGYFNRSWALAGLNDAPGSIASLATAAGLNPQFASMAESARLLPPDDDLLTLFSERRSAPGPEPVEAVPGHSLPPWALLWGKIALGGLTLGALFVLLRRDRAAAPEVVSSPPALLAGKYQLGRELGSGGMGVVYKGRDLSLDRVVAIKRMREEVRWDPKERARFVAEAQLVAKLKHPHIVEIHTIVEQDGEVYLIFEYVAGRTLREALDREKKIPFRAARDLLRGAAAGLDYAHSFGVVHRDLKPANIMIDADGRVRLMDFGIARLTEEALTRHTRTSVVVGTPLYMAPEQEQGVARKESDVYSTALCLYEALTGRRPFSGSGAGLLMNKLKSVYEPPSKLDPGLPRGLDDVFAKAFDPDPDKRYATAGAFLRALESLDIPPRAQ